MPFIRELIHQFDANVEFAKPITRYLQYVSAGDVLPVLVQALNRTGHGGSWSGRTARWRAAWRESGTAATTTRRRRHYWRNKPIFIPIWWQLEHGRRQLAKYFGGTLHATGQYHAASGHSRKLQAHRRSACQLHHRARKP